MTDTPSSTALALPGLGADLVAATGIPPAAWDRLDTDTLVDVGAHLSRRVQADMWVLGDFACALIDRLGPAEAIAQLVVDGHDPALAGRAMAVASAVGHAVRRADLSWSHHVEVRRLGAEDQGRWLEQAATNGWSARALRQKIREATEAGRTPLGGLGPLPRPSERLLRRALESGATAVLWDPEGGALGAAKVLDVRPLGEGRSVVAVEVPSDVAGQFGAGQVAA